MQKSLFLGKMVAFKMSCLWALLMFHELLEQVRFMLSIDCQIHCCETLFFFPLVYHFFLFLCFLPLPLEHVQDVCFIRDE